MAKAKKTKTKKSGLAWRGQILLIAGIGTGAIFLPSTILLMIGMIPTPFALLTDHTKGKNKVITVGAMNLAGCSPFLFELWTTEHTFSKAMMIVTDPFAIVVMWSAAAVGYILNWAMTGIVSSVLYQKGQGRQKAIQKRQKELIERWGAEVTGDMPLDPQGFPLHGDDKPKTPGT
jgi:hypothetical protein